MTDRPQGGAGGHTGELTDTSDSYATTPPQKPHKPRDAWLSLVSEAHDTKARNAELFATLDFYAEAVRDVMLDRIVMFGADSAFQRICSACADELGITVDEAAEVLFPVTRIVYRAAHDAWRPSHA